MSKERERGSGLLTTSIKCDRVSIAFETPGRLKRGNLLGELYSSTSPKKTGSMNPSGTLQETSDHRRKPL